MEARFGHAGVEGNGDAEVRGLALVGFQGAMQWCGGDHGLAVFGVSQGGDVPVTRASTRIGGSQGNVLDLNGSRTGIREVGGDAEGLSGNGGGEGVLRIGREAGAAAIGRCGRYDRRERDAERLDDGAVELRLLHRELVVDVVFLFEGEIGGCDLLHQ